MNDSRFTIHNSQLELIIKYFPDLTGRQKEQFAALYDLYADWNAKINVVSRKDFDQLYPVSYTHLTLPTNSLV